MASLIDSALSSPPILDFSPFYGNDLEAKAELVANVRKCCLHNGFFQIVGHRVPTELQSGIFKCSKNFFDQPLEEKKKCSKDLNTYNREGYFLGEDLACTHPYSIQRKLNSGPNLWPDSLPSLPEFKRTTMSYYSHVCELAKDILAVLALTLDLPEDYFHGFTEGAVATMRLLHYPPQRKDDYEKLARGIGAHTDFGAVALLLQEEVGGLQVWEQATETWLDVEPTKGAYVVNLGNMFMRWSNDRYISNLHRVINKSGRERYSVPLFFSGNPDYMIECLPNCCKPGQEPKYKSVSVTDAVGGSYRESFGRAQKYKDEKENAIRGLKKQTVIV